MAQVSSDNSTKHKHIKPVAVAQDREEVLSFSIRNSNNSKRKIRNADNNNDDDDDTSNNNVHGDERIIVQQRRVRKVKQSQLLRCWCTFHDFRVSTIQEHPSFVWLGPSSMAVYWYKEYLQTMTKQGGWIRIPKEPSAHPATAIIGTTIRTLIQRNKLERNKPQQQKQKHQNSKGNFYFIPGQYLRPDPPCDGAAAATTTDTTTAATISTGKNNNNSSSTIRIRMMIQNILKYGIPDIHYATSYIGVYNLIRSYGRFIKISKKNQIQNTNISNKKIGNRNSRSSSNKRRRCNKEEDEKQQQHQHQHQQNQKEDEDEDIHIVIPFDYKGPDLIIPKEQLDD
jgi:hypothetical protein